jgi:hypothetical protein
MLLRFNLSSVPSTFPLARAELRLFALGERMEIQRVSHTIYVARFLKPWNEGRGVGDDGQAAQKGEVTFNSARHGVDRWEKPGAVGLTDVADWESSATVGENYPEWVAFDVTQSVREFLRMPSLNHGWKISQDSTRGHDDATITYSMGLYTYKSSEAPQPELCPMLVLIPREK